MVNRIFETVKHLYHPDTTKESAHMITFTKNNMSMSMDVLQF